MVVVGGGSAGIGVTASLLKRRPTLRVAVIDQATNVNQPAWTLVGVGAAVLMIIAVSLLMFGLHLVAVEAAPIALFSVCLSSATDTLLAHRQGKVRYRAAGYCRCHDRNHRHMAGAQIAYAPLTFLFVLVLFYAAISMLLQSKKQDGPAINITDAQSAPASMPCQLVNPEKVSNNSCSEKTTREKLLSTKTHAPVV